MKIQFDYKQALVKIKIHFLKWNERYIKLEEKIKKLLIKSFIIIITLGILLNIYNEFAIDYYLIGSFKVPADFEKMGVSGDLLAIDILDKKEEMKRIGNSIKGGSPNYVSASSIPEIEIQGVSLKSVISYFKTIFGIKQKTISGRLIQIGNTLKFTMTVTNHAPYVIKTKIKDKLDEANLDTLISKSAEQLLQLTEPYLLASFYETKGNYEEAIRMIKYVIQVEKNDHAWAYNLWGNIMIKYQQYDKAVERYSDAIKADSEFDKAYYGLANAYTSLKKYDLAEINLKKAQDLEPSDPNLYNSWGFMFGEKKEFDKAISMYNKALEIDSLNILALNSVGNIYLEQEKGKEAIPYLKKSYEIDNSNTSTLQILGYAYQLNQQYDLSMEVLNEALQIDSSDSGIYGTLAETYGMMKLETKFYQTLDKALQLGYDISTYLETKPYIDYSTQSKFIEILDKYSITHNFKAN